MFYVYILKSLKDCQLYIGYTKNLQRRFNEHNNGKSLATKNRIPLTLVYYEAYLAEIDAKNREKFFKTGWGRNYIKRNLKKSLLI
ncbi:MAG: GIY-YIG nuclease family protein [Candidatus Buchananbacteria bacterium]|nr:GIY-YIG nuclease family protein [Candidatus Buchananbacteria bacterium]